MPVQLLTGGKHSQIKNENEKNKRIPGANNETRVKQYKNIETGSGVLKSIKNLIKTQKCKFKNKTLLFRR
jgi:hypothetical protein